MKLIIEKIAERKIMIQDFNVRILIKNISIDIFNKSIQSEEISSDCMLEVKITHLLLNLFNLISAFSSCFSISGFLTIFSKYLSNLQ